MTDTTVLTAVQTQYRQAEQELRAAAEAFRQLEATTRQLAVARDALQSVATDLSRGAGAVSQAGTQFADGAAAVSRATRALEQADPVRLAALVESLVGKVQERVEALAVATRAMEVRAESTHAQVLVAIGETSTQIRTEVGQTVRVESEQAREAMRAESEKAREAHKSDVGRVTAAVGDAEKAAIARYAAVVREIRVGMAVTVIAVVIAVLVLRG